MTINTRLRAEICKQLLAAVGLPGRWMDAGPAHDVAGDVLNPEQQTMLGIANSIRDATGQVGFSAVWNELEPDRVTLIGTLLVVSAYGDAGLSDWLAIQVNEPGREKSATVH